MGVICGGAVMAAGVIPGMAAASAASPRLTRIAYLPGRWTPTPPSVPGFVEPGESLNEPV
ncbi:MAG TPA: hypothetical protein PK336_04525 [Methanoculleus sp.]|nr:hypothetical protein [Methanoculleus sp.]